MKGEGEEKGGREEGRGKNRMDTIFFSYDIKRGVRIPRRLIMIFILINQLE